MAKIDPNPPRGERQNFENVNTRLSREIIELVDQEIMRRKRERLPNRDFSSIVREALVDYLSGKN